MKVFLTSQIFFYVLVRGITNIVNDPIMLMNLQRELLPRFALSDKTLHIEKPNIPFGKSCIFVPSSRSVSGLR